MPSVDECEADTKEALSTSVSCIRPLSALPFSISVRASTKEGRQAGIWMTEKKSNQMEHARISVGLQGMCRDHDHFSWCYRTMASAEGLSDTHKNKLPSSFTADHILYVKCGT